MILPHVTTLFLMELTGMYFENQEHGYDLGDFVGLNFYEQVLGCTIMTEYGILLVG